MLLKNDRRTDNQSQWCIRIIWRYVIEICEFIINELLEKVNASWEARGKKKYNNPQRRTKQFLSIFAYRELVENRISCNMLHIMYANNLVDPFTYE
jgi:hypothetical protein